MTASDLTARKTLALAWPIVLAQMATAATGVVDTAVMARFGDKTDLAAVAVASVVFSFLYWAFGFLRMSTTGLTAQADGAGDDAEVRAILQRGGLIAFGLGVALVCVFPLVGPATLMFFDTTEAVDNGISGYFGARIWGAPAALAGFAVTGWLLGTGRTGALLVFQVVLNGVNAGLDAWFVVAVDLGPTGIGAGTAIAEWTSLAVGLVIVRAGLRPASGLFNRARIAALISANRDIMIRTLALLFVFAWFVRSGSELSTAVVAGNEVLLQFIAVSAFVLDAFAFVAEREVGAAFGARDRARTLTAIRLTSLFALGFGAVFALVYLLAGPPLLDAIIADPEARAVAKTFLPWCALVPFIGVFAWQLDGVFLGTTQGRALRNAALVTTLIYVVLDRLLAPSFGNAGVWTAFVLAYVVRALALGAYLPGLLAQLSSRPEQISDTSSGPR